MNLHQQGVELISQLRELRLEVLRSHPDGGVGCPGISQREIARRAGLHTIGTVELDHTYHEMLSLLHKDGRAETIDDAGLSNEHVRWRLSGQPLFQHSKERW